MPYFLLTSPSEGGFRMPSFLTSDWDSLISSWVGIQCPKMNPRVDESLVPPLCALSPYDHVLEAANTSRHEILMVERTCSGDT